MRLFHFETHGFYLLFVRVRPLRVGTCTVYDCVRLFLQETTATRLHGYAWRSLFPPFHKMKPEKDPTIAHAIDLMVAALL